MGVLQSLRYQIVNIQAISYWNPEVTSHKHNKDCYCKGHQLLGLIVICCAVSHKYISYDI